MAAPRYIVLIDSGSSSSRLSIFKSPPDAGAEERFVRLGIQKIFPPGERTENSQHDIENCGSGIHCARHEQDVKAHLNPILDAAVNYLKSLRGPNAPTLANTDIYLLATAGMRNLRRENETHYDDILRFTRKFIESYSVHFRFETTNIRTIPGQQEGLFAWTYLNYGRHPLQISTTAVLEMGGASHQLAYKLHKNSDPHARSICTKRSRKENVYARSWDDFGVDAFNNMMVKNLFGDNNPCLPTGQKVKTQNGYESTGEADFPRCLELATHIYYKVFEFPALPNSLAINGFKALSNYYYTYEFFSKRDNAGYIASEPYNGTAFNASVFGYCSKSWDEVKDWVNGTGTPEKYTQKHCLVAAAMLRVLRDARKPVSLNESEPWTWGAAALIANHGGLKLCDDDAQELPEFTTPEPLVGNGNLNVSLAQISPTLTPNAFEQPALIVPILSVPLWAYLFFAAALMLMGRSLVQRYRAKALGKISLPDVESASDMKDLAGTVQGLGGFYKD